MIFIYSNYFRRYKCRKNFINFYVSLIILVIYNKYSFSKEQPVKKTLPTIGMDYVPVTYKLTDGSLLNIHIYDTCGQERFDSISETYYKRAEGVLLVYDITNEKSFEKIKNYYVKQIRERCKFGIPILLLGNKTDLKDKRKVDQQEAIDLSINEEYIYKETSAYLNENVANAFETIVEMWNIENKKHKRHLSDENLENPSLFKNCKTPLTERSNTAKGKIIDVKAENKNIVLDDPKIKKKKKKSTC